MYQNQPSEKQIATDKAKKELVEKEATQKAKAVAPVATVATAAGDSSKLVALQATLGNFAYSASLPSAKEAFTTIENDLIKITIANKGGVITEATLKHQERFKKGSGELVSLIKDHNSDLNITLQTQDNRSLATKDLFFEPTLSKVGDNQMVTMRLKAGANEYLEYQYSLKPNDYMVGFGIRSQGLNKIINTSKPLDLEWNLKAFRNEKSISYEKRFADIHYEYEDGKDNNVGLGNDKEESPEKVSYIAFKQHFFTTILLTDKPFEN